MSNIRWMRRYLKLNMLLGFFLIWTVHFYITRFPNEVYGIVKKSLFTVDIENYFETISVFNLPAIVFIIITLFHVLIHVLLAKGITDEPSLKDVAITNAMITIAMLFGQILFVALIPETINGLIANKIIFVDMPRLSSDIVLVFNTNYVFAFGYILYGMFVLIKTMPPKEEQPLENDPEIMA